METKNDAIISMFISGGLSTFSRVYPRGPSILKADSGERWTPGSLDSRARSGGTVGGFCALGEKYKRFLRFVSSRRDI